MFSDQPSQILALLRSGYRVEVGGPVLSQPKVEKRRLSSRTQIVLGFAAIYLIWGSTYLGIRYAVETIPPLLMMGVRHFVAGALVYVWVRRRGTPAPDLRQWGYAVIAGVFLVPGRARRSCLGGAKSTFGFGRAIVCNPATLDRFAFANRWR